MPTNAFDNYFIPVDAVSQNINFTSGFSTSLENVLNDINENFERIISAPFIQGDTGRSVIKVVEDIYDGSNNFTAFGKALVSAIYGEDVDMTSIDTYNDLCGALPTSDITTITTGGTNIDFYSCQYLNLDLTDHLSSVDCYMIEPDTGTEDKIFVSLVFFIDERIAELQGHQDDWADTFIDRSCVLYGKAEYNTNTNVYDWEIKRYQLFPNLYWNSELGQFCWEINGVQTEVCAQGLRGDQGPIIPCWSCEGIRYTGNTDTDPAVALALNSQVWVTDVLSTNQELDHTPTDLDINDGDVIFIWFAEDSNSTPSSPSSPAFEKVSNFTIGIAKSNTKGVYVDYNNFYDFRTITDNVVLRTQLLNTGYSNLDPKHDLRGLFLSANGSVMSDPEASDSIHYVYSSSQNSVNNLHIVPTAYENTFSSSISSTDTAPSNNRSSLLCIDYNGIRSIPVDPSSIDEKYLYELSLTTDYTYGKLSNNNKYGFCVSLPNYNYSSLNKFDAELGLIAEPKNHIIFLGGSGDNPSPNNILERLDGSTYKRRTYGGSGYGYDNSPSIQVLRSSDSGSEIVDDSYDYETWKSIFNFAPYGPITSGDGNASALNLSYRKHIGLSEADLQHEVALCFTPKADLVEDSLKFLRVYLPRVGYVRDVSKNESGAEYVSSYSIRGDFNWHGYGGLHRWEYNQHNTLDEKKFFSEIFLYDSVRFLSAENNPTTNNELENFSAITSSGPWSDSVSNNFTPINNDYTRYSGGTRYTKGNDFIDLSLSPFLSSESNNISLVYFRCDGNGKFRPLLSCTLEKDFKIQDNLDIDYKIGDKLYISYITAKRIRRDTVNNICDIEFCIAFSDPRSFVDSNYNSGWSASDYLNERSIIKYNNNYCEDTEHVGILKIPDLSSVGNSILNAAVAVNFVVSVDFNNGKILSYKPSSVKSGEHAIYNTSDPHNYNLWAFSGDSSEAPCVFEEFSWYIVYYRSNIDDNYGSGLIRKNSFDRLYLSAPFISNSPEWSDSNNPLTSYWPPRISYRKYYDFYELEMGNTRFGSKPRRPLIDSIETGSFFTYDNSTPDNKVYGIKLNYINDQHDINIYGIDDNGTYDPDARHSMKTLGVLSSAVVLGQLTQINNDNMDLRSSLGTTNNNLSNLTVELNEDNINVTPLSTSTNTPNKQNEVRSADYRSSIN